MRKTLQNILNILDRKERKHFFGLLLLDILVSLADIIFLALLLWIVQFYIEPGHTGRFSFLARWFLPGKAVLSIAIFVGLFCIKNWFGYIISSAHFSFINRVSIRLSRNNLANYQQAAFSEYVHTDSSVHIRNICFRPFEFTQYMLTGFQQIVTQLSLMLIALIAIILFNAKLFLLLLLLLLPPVFLVFWLIKKRNEKLRKDIQLNNEESFKYVMDALKGYVESNIYNRNPFFLDRFVKARQKFSTALFDSMALQNLPARIIEIFAVLGLFILIVIITWTHNNSADMLITIGAFMAAAYKIIPGIVKVINVSGQMKAYEFSMNDLEQSKRPVEFEPEELVRKAFESFELKNISFTYNEQPVLQNFSMAVTKGDFIGISGISGKGKTTLLNLMLGFLESQSGDMFINGQPVNSEDIKLYWPCMAYVRQQSFFIYDTLLRNITLEETGYNKARLQDAVHISGLEKVISNFPEGLEKIITENGKNISGGQQQRVAIARALYKNADLVLLDEPFNELDERSVQILLAHFRELAAAGKAVVMITHDQQSLSYCNKIISLDEA